jgi:hypothetical protein
MGALFCVTELPAKSLYGKLEIGRAAQTCLVDESNRSHASSSEASHAENSSLLPTSKASSKSVGMCSRRRKKARFAFGSQGLRLIQDFHGLTGASLREDHDPVFRKQIGPSKGVPNSKDLFDRNLVVAAGALRHLSKGSFEVYEILIHRTSAIERHT